MPACARTCQHLPAYARICLCLIARCQSESLAEPQTGSVRNLGKSSKNNYGIVVVRQGPTGNGSRGLGHVFGLSLKPQLQSGSGFTCRGSGIHPKQWRVAKDVEVEAGSYPKNSTPQLYVILTFAEDI